MERLLFKITKPSSLECAREIRNTFEEVIRSTVPIVSQQYRIQVCIAEAITNLVMHSEPQAKIITASFGINDTGWWADINDDGGRWDPTVNTLDTLEFTDFEFLENGRGIPLLNTQCDQISYETNYSSGINHLRLQWLSPNKDKKPTVLVVEDDESLSRLFKIYLEKTYNVKMADNGVNALKILNSEHIDLVISDINMPEMSGLELRKELMSLSGNDIVPFVFLTAYNSTHMHEDATNLGVDDYLLKPIEKEQLLQTVDRVLNRSRQLYKQITNRIDKSISASLSPELPSTSHGWRLCVASRNTGIGGGDLLLYKDSQEQLMITLIDIMGHDDSAKFFSYAYGGYVRGLMHANTEGGTPAELLKLLSDSALQDKLLSQSTLTSCVASILENGRLSIASAAHPEPLLINKTGAEFIPVGGILPGLLTDTTYESTELQLTKGERIAIYTDGLFDSAENNHCRNALKEGVIDKLVETASLPIENSLSSVMALFDSLAGDSPSDDTMLLLMEPIFK